jgi:hypothetical protein
MDSSPKIQPKKIALRCPVCRKVKIHIIPEILIEKRDNISHGVIPILIPKKLVCDHEFISCIDKNFVVREFQEFEKKNDKYSFVLSDTGENIEQKNVGDLTGILKYVRKDFC